MKQLLLGVGFFVCGLRCCGVDLKVEPSEQEVVLGEPASFRVEVVNNGGTDVRLFASFLLGCEGGAFVPSKGLLDVPGRIVLPPGNRVVVYPVSRLFGQGIHEVRLYIVQDGERTYSTPVKVLVRNPETPQELVTLERSIARAAQSGAGTDDHNEWAKFLASVYPHSEDVLLNLLKSASAPERNMAYRSLWELDREKREVRERVVEAIREDLLRGEDQLAASVKRLVLMSLWQSERISSDDMLRGLKRRLDSAGEESIVGASLCLLEAFPVEGAEYIEMKLRDGHFRPDEKAHVRRLIQKAKEKAVARE